VWTGCQRSDPVTFNSYNQTYSSAWQAPLVILTLRFVDFGVQVDF
jgi:hypothetical protein